MHNKTTGKPVHVLGIQDQSHTTTSIREDAGGVPLGLCWLEWGRAATLERSWHFSSDQQRIPTRPSPSTPGTCPCGVQLRPPQSLHSNVPTLFPTATREKQPRCVHWEKGSDLQHSHRTECVDTLRGTGGLWQHYMRGHKPATGHPPSMWNVTNKPVSRDRNGIQDCLGPGVEWEAGREEWR